MTHPAPRQVSTGLPSGRGALVWTALGLLLLSLGANALAAARPYQPVSPDPLLESWRWRIFPELSGLDAQCVAAAPDGTLWFGTGDGIASYDGLEWKRELADNNAFIGWVAAICFEGDGSLVTGGWWGVSRFQAGRWARLFPNVGLPAPDVRDLVATPDGTIWAATSWGALRWQNNTWTLYTDAANLARLRQDARYPTLRVESLPEALLRATRPTDLPVNRADLTDACVDAQGTVWFGTKGGEVLRYTGEAWTLFNEADGLVSGRLASLLPRRDGSLWVAHGNATALSVFTTGRWQTLALPAPGTAANSGKLLETRDGIVWLSARYSLLAYRDGAWRTYDRPQVPVPVATNHLAQSPDGALWLVGPNTDVVRIDYQTPRWLTLRDLNFQCETLDGTEWFLHRDDRVVRRRGDHWTSFGPEDGLPDRPVALLIARDGTLWAAGSHEGIAATARYDGQHWLRETHPDFAWGIDYRATYAARDGSVWFGAAVDSGGPREHRNGLLQYRNGVWLAHRQPDRAAAAPGPADPPATQLPASRRMEPIEKYTAIAESRDGKIWTGRNVLVQHDGTRWTEVQGNPSLRFGIIEAMFTTRAGELWLGTRQYGALRHDGRAWRPVAGGLIANSVRSFAETSDGSLWAATDRGVSRFDGQSWTTDVLPAAMNIPHEGGALKSAASGALWINRHSIAWNRRGWPKSPLPDSNEEFWTIRHLPGGTPPETIITSHIDRVSQPGNASILWRGIAAWRDPKDAPLQFSYRLDDQPWSPFSSAGGGAFFTLRAGAHRLSVRARDTDFNIDPTPATLEFIVLPPVWQQTWFIALVFVLVSGVAAQTVRVWLHQRRLEKAHGELEARVRQRTAELESANRELEAFSYSVSHDLRAPLRSIDGFSKAVLEDYHDRLDDDGRDSLQRIRAAAQRMGHLIEALLGLSRVTRNPLRTAPVDLSALATEIGTELAAAHPGHHPELVIAPGILVHGDATLLRNLLTNLLGNAWKFTAGHSDARIEFGVIDRAGQRTYFVRDNGAGFDRAAARNLFGAFQRFHTANEFPGTGIGLATVRRIVHRHGGQVDAESRPGAGATFSFTLPTPPPSS